MALRYSQISKYCSCRTEHGELTRTSLRFEEFIQEHSRPLNPEEAEDRYKLQLCLTSDRERSQPLSPEEKAAASKLQGQMPTSAEVLNRMKIQRICCREVFLNPPYLILLDTNSDRVTMTIHDPMESAGRDARTRARGVYPGDPIVPLHTEFRPLPPLPEL